jgi:cobalt-zinc-cadmium efflux system outer membrane protein
MTAHRHYPWLVGLALLPGCGPLSQSQIDQRVNELSARVDGLDSKHDVDAMPRFSAEPARAAAAVSTQLVPPAPAPTPAVVPASYLLDDKPVGPVKPPRKLDIPPGLPGSDAPPLDIPIDDPAKRHAYIMKTFAPLPVLPPMRPPAPGPEGHPLSLSDLQRLGRLYSPAVKNARAAVVAAEGAVVQSGAYPNPAVFFEQDTVETGQAGYQGFGFNQVIKTANKLKLQQAAAMMELLNAKLALRRAESDLAYQVRGFYFAVLVALENVRVSEAFDKFTEEIYKYQVDWLDKNFAAGYEPMQLRPLALAARYNLVAARNQYQTSWRQLAAALGLPDMPPSELEGRVDMPVPEFDFERVRAYMLENHTDVLTAINSIQKAHYNVALARVTPIPDVTVNFLVQKDYTTPPFQVVHSFQFGGPLPIWDQNRGAIQQAEGLLSQAAAQLPQSRNALVGTLAEAWNRYETNRVNVEIALQQVRDQLRVYKGVYERRFHDPMNVAFADVVTAQQTLAGFITGYVTALGLQWQAVVDVANLLQTDDLYQVGRPHEMVPVPDLKEVAPPPRMPPAPPESAKDVRGAPARTVSAPARRPDTVSPVVSDVPARTVSAPARRPDTLPPAASDAPPTLPPAPMPVVPPTLPPATVPAAPRTLPPATVPADGLDQGGSTFQILPPIKAPSR